jgi:hypothetical protein
MEIPVHYENRTVHLTLDDIASDDISASSSWISHLNTDHPDSTHQINLNASHPLFATIINTLTYCIPHYDTLSYVHIYQKGKHYLTPKLQRSLLSAIRSHPYGENITLQVDINGKHSYY